MNVERSSKDGEALVTSVDLAFGKNMMNNTCKLLHRVVIIF